MKTPYQLLGVNPEATDAEIKQAYLQKVKDNPPDKDQQKFQAIHHAYISIKNIKSRVSYDLFTLPVVDFDEVVDQILRTEDEQQLPPTSKQFHSLLFAWYEN